MLSHISSCYKQQKYTCLIFIPVAVVLLDPGDAVVMTGNDIDTIYNGTISKRIIR